MRVSFLTHVAQQKMTALAVVPSGFTAGLMTQFCILQSIIPLKRIINDAVKVCSYLCNPDKRLVH